MIAATAYCTVSLSTIVKLIASIRCTGAAAKRFYATKSARLSSSNCIPWWKCYTLAAYTYSNRY